MPWTKKFFSFAPVGGAASSVALAWRSDREFTVLYTCQDRVTESGGVAMDLRAQDFIVDEDLDRIRLSGGERTIKSFPDGVGDILRVERAGVDGGFLIELGEPGAPT